MPRFKRFTVAGIFSVGNGFGFDSKLAFMRLQDAQAFFQLGGAISGIKLKLYDAYKAPLLADTLQQSLGESYLLGDWTQQFGAFFKAVKMEKTMMFMVLALIIAVAAFNLVSSLVMAVRDKQPEIAILRTMGATPRFVLAIFMCQGMLLSLMGTVLGAILGVILACNVTAIVEVLQSLSGVSFLSSNVYFVDYLPSQLQWIDVYHIIALSLGLSLLATVYPAWHASKILPAEALRYE